jgi:outer membrane protein OmpA-like peptidoglycan-associated protein
MKTIILTESQVKNVIKRVLNEQPAQQEYDVSWQLCGAEIIKKSDGYYGENAKGEFLKLPLASQLSGTIDGGSLAFDDEIFNGLEIGFDMKRLVCRNNMPMQYAGATTNGEGGGWFLFIDDLSKQFDEPTPVYSLFTWNGSLRMSAGLPNMLKVLREKDGVEIKYQVSRTKNFILELSPALRGRKNKPSTPDDTPTPVKQPEYEQIKLDIQSPFEFDKTTLTPEAEVEFKKFVDKVKSNYQGVSGDVEVISSASIDADENKKRDYNQRLSDNRATTIANRLKTETGITTLNFIPKGIGQTDQFAKGMKYPEVRDTNQTAPNRRLIINMPTLTREKK